MTVDLITNPGGLFKRIAQAIKPSKIAITERTAFRSDVSAAQDQLNTLRSVGVNLQSGLKQFESAKASAFPTTQKLVADIIIEMVHADDPLPIKRVDLAIDRLIGQMNAATRKLNGNAVAHGSDTTGQVDGTANVGNGSLVWSLTDSLNRRLDFIRAEDIVFTCVGDAQNGGSSGQEQFTVQGEQPVADPLDPDWPGGSGISQSITPSGSDIEAIGGAGQNMLVNSDFEDETVTDTPDTWTISVGTVGTTIKVNSTAAHRGSNGLEIVGNGSQLTKLYQPLNDATNGTGAQLYPDKKYLLWFWLKRDGIAPAAGVLHVSVGGTTISVTLSATTNAWVLYSAVVHTSRNPASLSLTDTYVIIELTTALTNARSIYIDDVGLAEMVQLGAPGGPFCLLIPGSTDFIRRDRIVAPFTNSKEGILLQHLDRHLASYQNGFRWPAIEDASEYVLDALIV